MQTIEIIKKIKDKRNPKIFILHGTFSTFDTDNRNPYRIYNDIFEKNNKEIVSNIKKKRKKIKSPYVSPGIYIIEKD